jgi:hypothetical protein
MEGVDLLSEARAAGADVSLDGALLVVEGFKRHKKLVERLFQNKASVVEALLAESKNSLSSAPTVWTTGSELTKLTKLTTTPDWPAAAADFVLLLAPDDLPAEPFQFGGPWCIVVDRQRFLAHLQSDVRRGPAGPRSRFGAIQRELVHLRAMLTTSQASHLPT